MNINIKEVATKVTMAKPDWTQDGQLLQVYRVPLEFLYYNDDNGRIATWISEHKSHHGENALSEMTIEDYNDLIHEFIKKSNTSTSFKNTYNDIHEKGQIRPGVVLKDGRVVSGNRRFTVLRELYKNTGNDKYAFFECFILDQSLDLEHERKEIKTIERMTQFGVDEKVDYDPIDRLVDVYNDLIGPRKIWSQKEYERKLGLTRSQVSTMYIKASIMADYLEYKNQPESFYIARNQKLDGPLQELVSIYKKTSKAEWNRIRPAFYSFFGKEGDTTRNVRDLKKTYNSNKTEFNTVLNSIIDDIEKSEQALLEDLINPSVPIDASESTESVPNSVIPDNRVVPPILSKETERIFAEAVTKTKTENIRQKKVENVIQSLEKVYQGAEDALKTANKNEKARLFNRLKLAKQTIDKLLSEQNES